MLTRRVVFRVSEADIAQGCEADPLACAISRCLYRTLRGLGVRATAAVGNDVATIWVESEWTTYALPWHVQEAIRRYDATGKMRPLWFFLDLPAWWFEAARAETANVPALEVCSL